MAAFHLNKKSVHVLADFHVIGLSLFMLTEYGGLQRLPRLGEVLLRWMVNHLEGRSSDAPVPLPHLSSLWQIWVTDIPDTYDDDWKKLWDTQFKQLVSIRDRLIQFKIIHRAYFYPHMLHRINPSISSVCWWCNHSKGDFFHILWSCLAITSYWMDIIKIISMVTQTRSILKICLLGLVENLSPTTAGRMLIGLLLFYARKAIMLCWKKSFAHTIPYWKQLVNSNLPLYRDTIANVGCQKKVWESLGKVAGRSFHILIPDLLKNPELS